MKISIKNKKGFTLIEMLIVLVIFVSISLIVFYSFNLINNKQTLDKNIDFIKSIINQTRINTLNSKNGQDQTIIFSSSSVNYDNKSFDLSNNIILQSYNTGTNTITFYRLTGNPSATGTLIYALKSGDDIVATTSIIINNLGIIEQ